MSGERALPPGWARAAIEDLCDVLDHLRVPINAEERDARSGSFPYYGANGLAGSIDGFIFDGPHILVAEDGGYFDVPGKAVAYMVDGKFWVNNHAHVLKTRGGIPHASVVHQLNQTSWNGIVSGTTRLKLTQASMRRVMLQVPPIAEQRRIVAKLDDLLARSRRAKEALAEIPALLERYRQSVLAAAFRGELTADWQAEATDGLTSADAQRAKGAWSDVELQEVVESSFYGPRFAAEQYVVDGVRTIRTTDMTLDGHVELRDPPRVSVSDSEMARFALQDGDLLVTRTGSIGRCAVYSSAIGPALPSAYLIRFRLDRTRVLPRYVLLFLLGPIGQRALIGGSRAVTQPNVNARTVGAIAIPLPSLAEQQAVVDAVDRLFARSDFLVDATEPCQRSLTELEQSILTRAFRGELVPQDPADEPASVLLDRIRAERAASPNAPRRRGREKRA